MTVYVVKEKWGGVVSFDELFFNKEDAEKCAMIKIKEWEEHFHKPHLPHYDAYVVERKVK